MGYMGFGLQKWIYTQKSKKAFSKTKKIYGDKLENFKRQNPEDEFENIAMSTQDRERLIASIRESEKLEQRRRIKFIIISLVLAIVSIYALGWIILKWFF